MIRYVGEGEDPGYWYAISYRDFDRDTKVAYPLGIHFVVRWWRDLHYWIRCVGKPGYRSAAELDMFIKGYRKATKRYLNEKNLPEGLLHCMYCGYDTAVYTKLENDQYHTFCVYCFGHPPKLCPSPFDE